MDAMVNSSVPAIAMETSVVLGYLNDESAAASVSHLIAAAERGELSTRISPFVWTEIDVDRVSDMSRFERVRRVTQALPRVARLGTWILGEDAFGHDASEEIQFALPRGLSEIDVEQFLSFCAQTDVKYFVTKDNGFLKESARQRVHDVYGFRVGTPDECIAFLTESAANG